MTILQGTMQDGTVLPVQVDAQGRLVAEGLQGAAGPQGPQGPQGEKGEKGDPGQSGGIVLPPGATEGAMLGWRDGALCWLETTSGRRAVTGEIVEVTARNGRVWSKDLTSTSGWNSNVGARTPSVWFTQGGQLFASNGDPARVTFAPEGGIAVGSSLLLNMSAGGTNWGGGIRWTWDGGSNEVGWSDSAPQRSAAWWAGRRFVSIEIWGSHTESPVLNSIELDGVPLRDSAPGTLIRFATSRDLDLLDYGQLIEQTDGNATGKVLDFDRANNAVIVDQVTGSWGPVNAGLKARGPVLDAAASVHWHQD